MLYKIQRFFLSIEQNVKKLTPEDRKRMEEGAIDI